jgi:hypothetical protein
MAAPSGVAMALVAKGGLLGTAGFLLAGALWWQSTWTGYRAIQRGDIATHIRAMIRSYCWALSAPAFRIVQAALSLTGLEDTPNYIISLWLSIAVSVWLAEMSISRRHRGATSLLASSSQPTGAIS